MYESANTISKLIYLTRRNPVYDRAGWTARWRQHGALGMSLSRWRNVARYVHCDLIEPRPEQRCYLADHDGIGLIWHHSIAHRDAHFADTTAQAIMVRDEEETFARPIALDCLAATEQIVLSPPKDGTLIKLTAFHQDTASTAMPGNAKGHVRNVTLPHPDGRTWGLPFQLVEEFWFVSEAETDRAARALNAASKAVCVLGREVELYRA